MRTLGAQKSRSGDRPGGMCVGLLLRMCSGLWSAAPCGRIGGMWKPSV
jgi:hypothetical protein